ncbi:MAG: biopolymer transporter ExbD [Pirellulaceae bacterium]
MGHDQRESSPVGVLIVIVGLAVVGIFGLVVVGGVLVFKTRNDQYERAVVAKPSAVSQAQATMEDPEILFDEMLRTSANTALRIYLDINGKPRLDDALVDTAQLKVQLARALWDGGMGGGPTVRLSADPKCPLEHVVDIVNLCRDVGIEDIEVDAVLPPIAPLPPTMNFKVSINADGTFHFQEASLSLIDLEAKLRSAAGNYQSLAVSLTAHSECSVRQISDAMQVIRKTGINDIVLKVADQ